MKKIVRYNGGTETYLPCSDPTKVLEFGKRYEVTSINVGDFQTNYELKGIKGSFNSVWFEDASQEVHMAYARKFPIIGKRYTLLDIEVTSELKTVKATIKNTSEVREIKCLENELYKVVTRNSVYFVIIR